MTKSMTRLEFSLIEVHRCVVTKERLEVVVNDKRNANGDEKRRKNIWIDFDIVFLKLDEWQQSNSVVVPISKLENNLSVWNLEEKFRSKIFLVEKRKNEIFRLDTPDMFINFDFIKVTRSPKKHIALLKKM